MTDSRAVGVLSPRLLPPENQEGSRALLSAPDPRCDGARTGGTPDHDDARGRADGGGDRTRTAHAGAAETAHAPGLGLLACEATARRSGSHPGRIDWRWTAYIVTPLGVRT